LCNHAFGPHLGVVPDALEQAVGHPGSAPCAPRDFPEPFVIGFYPEDFCRASDYLFQGCLVVEVQPIDNPEPVPQGRAEQGKAGGRTDERKAREVESEALSSRPFADYYIQGEVLQGRIEYLLDGAVEPVDFIDEKDILALEIRQDGRQVSGTLYRRARGCPDINADFEGDDMGEGCLAQAGGAVQQNVVQGFTPALGGVDGYIQVVLSLLLTNEVGQAPGPQAGIERCILFAGFTRYDAGYFGSPPR